MMCIEVRHLFAPTVESRLLVQQLDRRGLMPADGLIGSGSDRLETRGWGYRSSRLHFVSHTSSITRSDPQT